MSFLLDTNVISELTKPAPAPEVVIWLESQKEADLYLSAVTIGEVAFGLERLPAGAKRVRLQRNLDKLKRRYADRVIAFDLAASEAWATLRRAAERRKLTMPPIDAMLAATAQVHGWTLVTRNTRDFAGWDGPVLNPWAPSALELTG